MKLIFLDVDGVLNSIESMIVFADSGRELCPIRCGLVGRLIRETGAKVVVSSAWRTGKVEKTKEVLEKAGAGCIVPHIIGETGQGYDGHRGTQISEWIKANGEPEAWVILDDDSDMLPGQPFVHTSMACGFGLDDYLDALAILDPDHKDLSPLRGLAGYRGHWKRTKTEGHTVCGGPKA